MLISEKIQKIIVIILPFLNEVASIITNLSPDKSPFSKLYVGWRKSLIDYLVLLGICWSVAIVTYDKEDIQIGVIKAGFTILISYLLPQILLVKVLKKPRQKKWKIIYGISFIALLALTEALLWELIDNWYKPENPLRGSVL